MVAAATLYGLFSAWMLFPYFGVRRMLMTSAAALTWIEFIAVLAWGFSREDCARGSCTALAEVARTAVAVDLPALSIALVALAVADTVRRHRSSPSPVRATRENTAGSTGSPPLGPRVSDARNTEARHGADVDSAAASTGLD